MSGACRFLLAAPENSGRLMCSSSHLLNPNTTGSAETHKGVVHAGTTYPRSTPLCSKHADLLNDFSKECTAELLPAAPLLQLVHLGGLDQGVVLRKLLPPCSLVVEVAAVGFCISAAVELPE